MESQAVCRAKTEVTAKPFLRQPAHTDKPLGRGSGKMLLLPQQCSEAFSSTGVCGRGENKFFLNQTFVVSFVKGGVEGGLN